ncbi:hypothetical protein CIPAW_13G022500 [Carya illinoinensis]|uniref:Uncharacterized protein n=1 Tax=Carya illinoinensis TaxID=32201 RepID=A0A8T1NNZ8_CARIL|nr:hypothetical protein CIPAW_13G022500 [Carya illinoinensis]
MNKKLTCKGYIRNRIRCIAQGINSAISSIEKEKKKKNSAVSLSSRSNSVLSKLNLSFLPNPSQTQGNYPSNAQPPSDVTTKIIARRYSPLPPSRSSRSTLHYQAAALVGYDHNEW